MRHQLAADGYDPKTTVILSEPETPENVRYRLKVTLSQRFLADVKKYNKVEIIGINYFICSITSFSDDSPELELKLIELMGEWISTHGVAQKVLDDIFNNKLYGNQKIKLADGYIKPEDLTIVLEKRERPVWVPV